MPCWIHATLLGPCFGHALISVSCLVVDTSIHWYSSFFLPHPCLQGQILDVITFGELWKHFKSPQHPRDKYKTQHYVEIAGHSAKHHHLEAHLKQLHSNTPSLPPVTALSDQFDDELVYENYIDPTDQEFVPSDSKYQVVDDTHLPNENLEAQHPACKHVLWVPDLSASAKHLCNSLKAIVPTLISPYLHYISQTLGKPLPPFSLSITLCSWSQCTHKPVNILCLLFNCKCL